MSMFDFFSYLRNLKYTTHFFIYTDGVEISIEPTKTKYLG